LGGTIFASMFVVISPPFIVGEARPLNSKHTRQNVAVGTLEAIMRISIVGLLISLFSGGWLQAGEQPNVLWLTCEDISPNLGCYGDRFAVTPHLDQLAREGIRYDHAVGITGVCAVNRSCLITGMYSSSIGSQDMRSRTQLPAQIKCFPEYLRAAGYYCTNNVKTDYNFAVPKNAWDASSSKAHWRNRNPDQPFFAVFNYTGTHESQIWEQNHRKHAAKLQPNELHDPAVTPIPPFHPGVPESRRDWANYYDNISALDHWIARHLEDLEAAGLAEDTIVMFFSDHGAGMPGVKKWVWEGGLRVPLIIRFPSKYRRVAPEAPGSATNRLVSFVDFAPTVLSLCGIAIPDHMQGRAFLGAANTPPREAAHIIRDRMAERYDMVRGVRTADYQYLHNFMPHLPWAQYTSYTEQMPTMQVWRSLHEQGQLNAIQDRYFRPKPTEELYDLEQDPHMIHNLASNPAHQETLLRLRKMTRSWQTDTRDLALIPEYILHQQSEDTTPYALGRSQGKAYFSLLCEYASRAAARDPQQLHRLVKGSAHPDAAVRWWSVTGLVMLGPQAAPAEDSLKTCLTDDSPIVRIAAAEALCQLNCEQAAVPVLVAGLKHDTPFVRLRAMNAMDRLGSAAMPLMASIRQAKMPPDTIFPATYLNRMCDYIPEKFSQPK
jgi:N-sulfoglucosamine sulfohydrolase